MITSNFGGEDGAPVCTGHISAPFLDGLYFKLASSTSSNIDVKVDMQIVNARTLGDNRSILTKTKRKLLPSVPD
jgi:hypothetical protein